MNTVAKSHPARQSFIGNFDALFYCLLVLDKTFAARDYDIQVRSFVLN